MTVSPGATVIDSVISDRLLARKFTGKRNDAGRNMAFEKLNRELHRWCQRPRSAFLASRLHQQSEHRLLHFLVLVIEQVLERVLRGRRAGLA